jgi:SAM-dependent methyltransferase
MQNEIESIVTLNKLTALCRGYVEEAIAGAFKILDLRNILEKGADIVRIGRELNLEPSLLERFMYACRTMGLVTKNEVDQTWHATVGGPPPNPWREIQNWVLSPRRTFEELSELAFQLLSDANVLSSGSSGTTINQAIFEFLNPESPSFIGPLIESMKTNSAPSINGSILSELLRSETSDLISKPFSSEGWSIGALQKFLLAMHLTTSQESQLLLEHLKISENSYSVLDIGGGVGTVAMGFQDLPTPPAMTVVYDKQSSIDFLRDLNRQLGARQSICFSGGDFFSDKTHGLLGLSSSQTFDVITLGWILHDWNDQDASKILQKAVQHLKPSGSLCIIECIMPDDRNGPATLLDVTMMIQTEGRERTRSEYDSLCAPLNLKPHDLVDKSLRRQMLVYRRVHHATN